MCSIYFWKLCFLLNLWATESSTNCISKFIALKAYATLNKENIWFLWISNAMYVLKIFQDKLVNEVCWLINNMLLNFLLFFFFSFQDTMINALFISVKGHLSCTSITCYCQLYKVTGILSSFILPSK